MAEYVEREALLAEFENKLFQRRGVMPATRIVAKHLIRNAPSADVAPVVRCKDCAQWLRHCGIAESPNGHCFTHDIEMNGHDFCSYGERKGGDGDG